MLSDLVRPFITAILLALAIPVSASAATILQIDIDEMLAQSDLVFEGEVIDTEAKWNSSNTSIATYIEFNIKDVIKGVYALPTITLQFAGGTVSDTILSVEGLINPRIGEKGFYFVFSTTKIFINPLVGWSQRHFLVESDVHGIERVAAINKFSVMGLESSAPQENSRTALSCEQNLFSKGIAAKVVTANSRDQIENAMSKQQFEQALINRSN